MRSNNFLINAFITLSLLMTTGFISIAQTPVETHGRLWVEGNQIVGEHGEPVQLMGMSHYWSVWGPQKYYNKDVVSWLVSDWKVDLARASMAVEINQQGDNKGWLYNRENQERMVAGTHGSELREKGDCALSKGIALFITEWGTSKADGGRDGTIYPDETEEWINWALERNISMANWSLADLGMAEIIGCIYSSGKVPYGAGITEAINIYYGRPDIPIGAYYGDEVGDPVDKMTAGKLVRDTIAFGNRIIHNTDTEEQTRLNRRLLSEQEDGSITYITIGHTKGLYELLVSEPDDISPLGGRELIIRKVSRWIALGALNANNEGNYFVRDWLWEAQRFTLDDQRPSWDLAAVYFAVEGTGEYLVNMGRGMLEFDTDKGCRWHPGENTLPEQYFIMQKSGTDESFAVYLNEMIAAEPVLNKSRY